MTNANNIYQQMVDQKQYANASPKTFREVQSSEKMLTKRATHQSVEEIYTMIDVNQSISSLDSSIGYPFDYPYRWLTDESQDRRIGIRRLEVTPSAHTFEIEVNLFGSNCSLAGGKTARFDITPDDDIVQIMHLFVEQFNIGVGNIMFEYNEHTGELTYWYEDGSAEIGGITITGYRLMNVHTSVSNFRESERGVCEFMKMLNMNDDGPPISPRYDPTTMDLNDSPIMDFFQNRAKYGYIAVKGGTNIPTFEFTGRVEDYDEYDPDNRSFIPPPNYYGNFRDSHLYPHWFDNYRYIADPLFGKKHVIPNVWNRKTMYFHASFSTSKRQLIGKRGDWYPTPSVWYPAPTSENTFYIQLSTDSEHKIFVRYGTIDIQLCFSYH